MPFQILNFPNELIIEVINVTYGQDLENLAMTNKRMWGLSQKALRENLPIKQRYSTVDLGGHSIETPANLLTMAYNDPRIGHGISTLRIHDWRGQWSTVQGMPVDYPSQIVESLSNKFFPNLNDNLRQTKLLAGDEALILEVLILLLPRLDKLEVNVSGFGHRDCPVRDLCEDFGVITSGIKTIHLHDTEWTICHSRLVRDMVKQASKESIIFEYMRIDCEDNCEELWIMGFKLNLGHITSLSLRHCRVGSKTIHSFITDDSFPDYLVVDPYFIRTGLEIHSKATLENLTILGCYHVKADKGKYYQMGSLRNFTKLQYISVHAETLIYNTRMVESASLDEQLPASTQDLVLHINTHDYLSFNDMVCGNMGDFLEHPSLEELPSIESLTVHGLSNISTEYFDTLDTWATMRRRGIVINWELIDNWGESDTP